MENKIKKIFNLDDEKYENCLDHIKTNKNKIEEVLAPTVDLYEKIINYENVNGSFNRLMLTHNMPFFTLEKIVSGEYKRYLRCCDDSGELIDERGLQFRYGVDSQYGDIIFVMKDDIRYWEKKKGVDIYNETKTESSFINRFNRSYEEKATYNSNKMYYEELLLTDAVMYGFRGKSTPQKNEYTWCNTQFRYAENISFKDVYKILFPEWLLYNKKLIKKNKVFVKCLKNKLEFFEDGERNLLNGKFVKYGSIIPEDNYDYYVQYQDLHLHIKLSEKTFKIVEKKYMKILLENGCNFNSYYGYYLLYIIPKEESDEKYFYQTFSDVGFMYGGYHMTLFSAQLKEEGYNMMSVMQEYKKNKKKFSPKDYKFENGYMIYESPLIKNIQNFFMSKGWENPTEELHITLNTDNKKLINYIAGRNVWYLQLVKKVPRYTLINNKYFLDPRNFCYVRIPGQTYTL